MNIDNDASKYFFPDRIDNNDPNNYIEIIRSAITPAKKASYKRLETELLRMKLTPISSWSEPMPLDGLFGLSKKRGLYFIIYSLTGEIMYIGKGNLNSRISRARDIFNNDGESFLHENSKSTTDHIGARKAYHHDPNIDNWEIRYMVVPTETFQNKLETELIRSIDPPFNEEYMAGKG
jgi:hypothetical protein